MSENINNLTVVTYEKSNKLKLKDSNMITCDNCLIIYEYFNRYGDSYFVNTCPKCRHENGDRSRG